jgi:hypothetical protein
LRNRHGEDPTRQNATTCAILPCGSDDCMPPYDATCTSRL